MEKSIGQRVKAIRLSEGMTLQEFANFLGTTPTRICLWEHDKVSVSLKYRRKIRDKLGYDIYYDIDMQIEKRNYRRELGL